MSNLCNINNRRQILTPLGPSGKRKERDIVDISRTPKTTKAEPVGPSAAAAAPAMAPSLPSTQKQQLQQQPGKADRLLAGYLAHEFLTKGTLFGQRWDPPAAAAAAPVAPRPQQAHKPPPPKHRKPIKEEPAAKPMAYADVAQLLKADGIHIPGIVNPTELARWLQM